MAAADEAAAHLQPIDVAGIGYVVARPEQQHHDDAEREGEGEEVVRQLARGADGGEGLRPHQRQQQVPAEGEVEAGEAEHQEAAGDHPVVRPLQQVEAGDGAAGGAAGDGDAALEAQEEIASAPITPRMATPPTQVSGGVVEFAPGLALRLDQVGGARVRDGDAALDPPALQGALQFHLVGRDGAAARRAPGPGRHRRSSASARHAASRWRIMRSGPACRRCASPRRRSRSRGAGRVPCRCRR